MIALGLIQIFPLAVMMSPGMGIPMALFVATTGAAVGLGI